MWIMGHPDGPTVEGNALGLCHTEHCYGDTYTIKRHSVGTLQEEILIVVNAN